MKHFSFLSFLLFIAVLPVYATRYYVSYSGGNNSNNGQSAATSFQTIDRGLTAAAAYDTVMVAAGTYPISATLTINRPITVLGSGAVLDASGWSPTSSGKKCFG